ncbi:RimK family alpha-L-glutamate ligase [Glycomyces sp. TRM65418]|uniref:RimK family alpha-L-glutamate ligase n=1 Tax=Glycomyces sp. TRM65418 TaxID=2867006 RepID=UPI001CE5A07D|nr:RimK family alpha-L-glutamate ligase [Glycomyces sp. TRM65418]MCC3763467.1 RimK family alpha-L-glutamate ligase [Glycomyces sp. TRM65418]QZD57454.1 RimK family alpha-L-glutamate ligase [Glycomyces sp. TRM65418]
MNDLQADVLLSVTVLRPEEKLLGAALRARGLAVTTLLPPDLGAVVRGGSAARLGLIRNVSHQQAHTTARLLEHSGIDVLNRSSAIEACGDKGIQALMFSRHGVPHPESHLAFSFDQVREAVAAFGWPSVVKPVSGSWGRGVTRMVNVECVDAWIGGRESADAAGKLFPVLVQEYVDKPGHDLRVVVVGAEPVAAIRRVSEHWRTNTTLGADVERLEVTDEMSELCRKVTDILGEGFYGIDLVEDRAAGELKVLEVNANPEFAKSSMVHGVDIAAAVAEHVSANLATTLPAAG